MKIFLKYTLALTASLLLTISCRDEDAVRFPDLQTGANARVVVHGDKLVLNFLDIDNASTIFDIYSKNNDIEEFNYLATFVDADFPAQKYPTVLVKTVAGSELSGGKILDVEITANELAAALDLPGGGAYLKGGDYFTIWQSVTLKDGRVFEEATNSASIVEGTNSSFTNKWNLFVSCPFIEADAIGSYTLVTDPGEWATATDLQVEMVAGPGANQMTIVNALGYPQEFDIIVDVDPVTGAALVAKDPDGTWDSSYWGLPYGIGYTDGSGFFFSCSGFLTLKLKFTVDAGSFGIFAIEYLKN